MGLFAFVGYRMWYLLLIRMARQYDVPTRRKIASRYYLILAPLSIVAVYLSVICSMTLIPKDCEWRMHLLFITNIAVLVPALLSILFKMNSIRDLGYGRRNWLEAVR